MTGPKSSKHSKPTPHNTGDKMNTTLAVATTTLAVALPAATLETCDGCGAGVTALFSVLLPSGSELTLCRHHAVKYGMVHQDVTTYLNQTGAERGENDAAPTVPDTRGYV